MATDEEYLDNLLKAAMEEDAQGSREGASQTASEGFGAVDEEEDWKNSLDEMLASVNTMESDMGGGMAETDAGFPDFTDRMDESGRDAQTAHDPRAEELDITDLGITDLGFDMLDEAMAEENASESADLSQDDINELLGLSGSKSEGSESGQESAAKQEDEEQAFGETEEVMEEQEEAPGKSRKELQEEKKEKKRLAKEEKRMAKERKKDEKKAEKESKKEAKKRSAFGSFMDFLMEEAEEEKEEAKEGAEGEELLQEGESGEEEKSGKKGKKKKDKKGKKGKKGQETAQEGEEGGEGEEAPDPKKAAKLAKKALREQKKKEKAERVREPRKKVLTRKAFLVLVAFCATLVAAVVFLSVFLSDYVDKTRARRAFNNRDYEETYVLLYGKDLNSGDKVIYHRASLILRLERKLQVYEQYMSQGEEARALDTLLTAVAGYNEMAAGDTYGALDEMRSIYQQILDLLNGQYGISEEEAIEFLTYDDIRYSEMIYSITTGEDFGESPVLPEAPAEPQDVLPEEEGIINMDMAGEGA